MVPTAVNDAMRESGERLACKKYSRLPSERKPLKSTCVIRGLQQSKHVEQKKWGPHTSRNTFAKEHYHESNTLVWLAQSVTDLEKP